MHQELTDFTAQAMDTGYDALSLSAPLDSYPMSSQTSQQGDTYSMRSSPSPSPPSGTQPGAGRQRSRSGTGHLTMQQLNKKRQRATPEQLLVLEEAFTVNASPNAKMREMIADRIRMTERSVQIWFQNRRAKVKQMQRKEQGEDGAVYYGGMTGSPGMMDHMKRNALMRSNSLGHGGGYNALPPDIKYGLRMGFPNGPLTPAASPSSKTVISRLTIETLSIGPWHRVACSSMDLVCYFSPMEGRFTYYINNSSSGFKIEYPITCIRRIKMEHMVRRMQSEGNTTPVSGREETKHRARIMIELSNAPLFYSEQRVAGGWQLCHDFTQGLVASTILVHTLVGPFDALQQQMTELAAMSPELSSRLWIDDQPQYLAFDEDEHTVGTVGDRNRRHSSAASTMAPPARPASAIPAQFARQHLTPGSNHVFNGSLGGPRVRQSFQAHRRTRSRSLPTAVNVSDLALAAQHSNMVPGMKFGNDGQYMLGHDMLYNQQTPLRIDTSVADSTMDYYRQFTPGSNISSQITPVEYTSSPASQVPLPSALPFYEGNEYPVNPSYAHSGMYSTENMETPAIYSEDVNQPAMMNMEYHQDTFNYSTDPSMQDPQYTAVSDQQWAPHVTVSQMDVDRKDMESMMKAPDDVKMEMRE